MEIGPRRSVEYEPEGISWLRDIAGSTYEFWSEAGRVAVHRFDGPDGEDWTLVHEWAEW